MFLSSCCHRLLTLVPLVSYFLVALCRRGFSCRLACCILSMLLFIWGVGHTLSAVCGRGGLSDGFICFLQALLFLRGASDREESIYSITSVQ